MRWRERMDGSATAFRSPAADGRGSRRGKARRRKVHCRSDAVDMGPRGACHDDASRHCRARHRAQPSLSAIMIIVVVSKEKRGSPLFITYCTRARTHNEAYTNHNEIINFSSLLIIVIRVVACTRPHG